LIQIRQFRRSHLDRVLEIEAAAFPEDAYTREMFLAYFGSREAVFAVAKQSSRIVGYILASASGTEAEIVSIAVDPVHRRSGAGAALMGYALRRLGACGVRRVELAVRTTNAAALRLYRRFGFRRTIRMARYYEDGGDAWRMARSLA
jgi:[ribosomal protein S18]-alanine N-acetyltransferase